MKGRINLNPMFIRPPQEQDELKSYPLAYVLEGEFPSYFAGKVIPEKTAEDESADGQEQSDERDAGNDKDKKGEKAKSPGADLSKIEGEGPILSKGKRAKIFIMAASEMLKDNVLDDQGRTPNAMFIMNTLDFLNDREDIAVMRSKEQRLNPLRDTSAAAKTLIKSINIAGLPVLVVLFGFLVLLRRRARKRQIQMMFQQ
jgi:hypothetical protein